MLIFAVESSCDETSVSICEFDCGVRRILSNRIASQIDIHRLYGGVVPEIASRAHTEAITRLAREALEEANITPRELDAVAVTYTPGLVGALIVGVNFAKAFAYANGLPLVPVNHIKGHVAANYFAHPTLEPPFFALVASGGHTSLINVTSYTDYETVGRTRDDAMGEAFDKVARVMGLPYPGGAEMDRLASLGNRDAIKFPSAAIIGDDLDFSFSGLKTSVINYLHNAAQKGSVCSREDVAASFTKTVENSVIKKLGEALERYRFKTLVVAGGVSANSHLRRALGEFADAKGITVCLPPRELCGDNGAMIASQAYYEYLAGARGDTSLNAIPS